MCLKGQGDACEAGGVVRFGWGSGKDGCNISVGRSCKINWLAMSLRVLTVTLCHLASPNWQEGAKNAAVRKQDRCEAWVEQLTAVRRFGYRKGHARRRHGRRMSACILIRLLPHYTLQTASNGISSGRIIRSWQAVGHPSLTWACALAGWSNWRKSSSPIDVRQVWMPTASRKITISECIFQGSG